MFGTIRKHQTWLWIIISGATIISFVYFFTPTVGRGGGRAMGGGNYGTMNGRAITRKEYTDAWMESQIGLFLRTGVWPDRGELLRSGTSLETETRNRLVVLDQIRDLDIQVGVEAISDWITRNLGDPRQPGTAKAGYDHLVRTVFPRYGATEADFQRFVRNQVAITHLLAVEGVPGKLTPPREAAAQFRQENEKVEASVVLFSASSHLASVTLDPAALNQYYTNNQSTYRIPERVQVHYVRFANTNFVADANAALAKRTNLAQEIDQIYLGSSPGSFADTNGQVLPPDAAKSKIRERMFEQQCLLAARRAATSFATNLQTMTPVKADNLVNLAAAKGILPGLTEPFSEMQWPTNVSANEKFIEAAFRLTPQAPFSPPVVCRDGVYLLALKEHLPSAVPAIDAIRERVTEDFRLSRARSMAREAATNFVRLLTNGLAQGKSFDALCAEAKLTPITLPRFAASTRTLPDLDRRVNLEQLKSATAGKSPGQPSDVVPTMDGALVACVKARTPVTDGELKAELPKFLADLRQTEQVQAFNEWFRRQLEASRINTLKGRDETPAGTE